MSERFYHILLVEDSTTQAISLTAILEHEGWKVTWVSSAEKAFSALRETQPDLILLDYYLPGIRGDEVCRRIRMNVDCRNLPIVLLTSQEDNQVQGLDSGADDFVVKSSSPEILLVRLRTLLQKSRHEERIIAGAESSFRPVRLLAIDDSAVFLERLREELAGEGYELETSDSPEASLERLRTDPFDGVIVDLIMPRIDGFEVCRRVNELRTQMHLPLISILLTGAESVENLSKALEAGADDFVGKSNDFSVLKGRIRALLRRKFFAEENNRILRELRQKEMEAVRERAAKEAAQARAALVEQLELRTEELNQSREELRNANAAKDQFLAVLSHELRTPLTPVLAVVAERCNDPDLSDDLRRDFEMIRRNVELEVHLINDLLDLTRIIQGKLEIQHESFDLREVIDHVITMCSKTSLQQPQIQVALPSTPAHMWGDPTRITQVIWNLLQNALKFTPADGRIDLKLLAEGSSPNVRYTLEVRDTGIGIEPDRLVHIFDAFQQEGRHVTREFGGLGLGLAISRAITERHGGQLTATSAGRGTGATFRLTLPEGSSEVPSSTQTQPIRPSQDDGKKSATAQTAPLSILLVEDHKDTRETMSRLLRRRGHQVTTAGSILEATEAAASLSDLDVLISDLGLPDGTGYDALKAVAARHQVRSIALSGYGMEEDIRKSLDAGFTLHLTKPVDFSRLEQALT